MLQNNIFDRLLSITYTWYAYMAPYTQRARPFGHALRIDDPVSVATVILASYRSFTVATFGLYCPSPGIRAAL